MNSVLYISYILDTNILLVSADDIWELKLYKYHIFTEDIYELKMNECNE